MMKKVPTRNSFIPPQINLTKNFIETLDPEKF